MECFELLKEVFGENAMYVCMFLNGIRYFLNVGIRLKMLKVPVDLWWQELKEIFRKLMKMCCETEVLAFGWSPTSWTITKNGLEKSHSGTKRQPQEHSLCRHETAYRGTKLVHKYHLIWWDMDYPVWTGNKALIDWTETLHTPKNEKRANEQVKKECNVDLFLRSRVLSWLNTRGSDRLSEIL